ncbi:MAG: 2-nonaprenyl-3-methyl-6-methoxy-1,4-benzoquinol hydroxylase [Candidatus Accumulibacter regalis]|jgi:ubiquinone biosynthesis monooxygenase Coq7|uniref:3-demethoxyubiquinol 3-hydroxylase n=1 Tax=Accumulibacter regalis TaxID=522306 RepID=A0A011Q4J6_ACCRE|nr:MAG: 2-nonaprenyl-3-methyl-6-methoxy-1,4-benzoquinol hydroxylase [Candidatus Accumulibacter regalis]
MITDRIVIEFDKALRTLFAPAPTTRRVPGSEQPEAELSDKERAHAAALMRINHVGEVCAQALYQGQALSCNDPQVRLALQEAAHEETEHLAWTERRLAELRGRTSLLNPLWYLGALSIGIGAGKLGDTWSLGFLAETERQVEAHLDHHLSDLPWQDLKSRAIVEQMRLDEISHAATAVRLGARELPAGARLAMRLVSRTMTGTAYYV